METTRKWLPQNVHNKLTSRTIQSTWISVQNPDRKWGNRVKVLPKENPETIKAKKNIKRIMKNKTNSKNVTDKLTSRNIQNKKTKKRKR